MRAKKYSNKIFLDQFNEITTLSTQTEELLVTTVEVEDEIVTTTTVVPDEEKPLAVQRGRGRPRVVLKQKSPLSRENTEGSIKAHQSEELISTVELEDEVVTSTEPTTTTTTTTEAPQEEKPVALIRSRGRPRFIQKTSPVINKVSTETIESSERPIQNDLVTRRRGGSCKNY